MDTIGIWKELDEDLWTGTKLMEEIYLSEGIVWTTERNFPGLSSYFMCNLPQLPYSGSGLLAMEYTSTAYCTNNNLLKWTVWWILIWPGLCGLCYWLYVNFCIICSPQCISQQSQIQLHVHIGLSDSLQLLATQNRFIFEDVFKNDEHCENKPLLYNPHLI